MKIEITVINLEIEDAALKIVTLTVKIPLDGYVCVNVTL